MSDPVEMSMTEAEIVAECAADAECDAVADDVFRINAYLDDATEWLADTDDCAHRTAPDPGVRLVAMVIVGLALEVARLRRVLERRERNL